VKMFFQKRIWCSMSAGRGKEYVPAAPEVWGRARSMVNARMIADRIEEPSPPQRHAVVGGAR